MKYRLLGRSGLRVSELCLGTMTFGEDWGYGAGLEESRAILEAYLEAGGNFVDTANRYTEGTSERWLGEFLHADRERVVLATKYSLFTRRDDVNASGHSRASLVRSLEHSLQRLRAEYVDLLWVHAWEGRTPLDEVLRALDDVVRQGKVLYVGISDAPAWVVSRADAIADLRGWSRFVGLQIEYSLSQRSAERELLPMARALDLGVTAWGPLAGGVLTAKYAPDGATADPDTPSRYRPGSTTQRLSPRHHAIAAEVRAVAEAIGRTPAQVALRWLMQREGVVIPIVGARRAAQARENLAAADFTLEPAMIERLDAASRIEPGFPHEFLAGDNVRDLLSGGHHAAIVDHRGGRTV